MPDGYGVWNIRLPCYLLVQTAGKLSTLSQCFRQILDASVAAVMTSQQIFLLSRNYELNPVQSVSVAMTLQLNPVQSVSVAMTLQTQYESAQRAT
jgi:hypothetical protein